MNDTKLSMNRAAYPPEDRLTWRRVHRKDLERKPPDSAREAFPNRPAVFRMSREKNKLLRDWRLGANIATLAWRYRVPRLAVELVLQQALQEEQERMKA